MPPRSRAAETALADARALVRLAAEELAAARRLAGSTQEGAGRRAGLSRAQYGRLERGELRRASIEDVCRAARAVGLRFSCRFLPSDIAIRDGAQLALLARLEARLGPTLRLHREVPLPIPGDLRAWDGRIRSGGRAVSVEAVSRLADVQALTRRVLVKQRDDPDAGAVLLLLGRTTHNRLALREAREALRAEFPLDGAPILRDLAAGRLPVAGGILLL